MKYLFFAAVAALTLTGAARAQYLGTVGHCEKKHEMQNLLSSKGYDLHRRAYYSGKNYRLYVKRYGQQGADVVVREEGDRLCFVPLRDAGARNLR